MQLLRLSGSVSFIYKMNNSFRISLKSLAVNLMKRILLLISSHMMSGK